MHKARMRFVAVATVTLAGLVLAGCHAPGGGVFSRSGGSQTYYSNELVQKTITMVDTRSNEVFFGPIDIPPDKQLVIDFEEGDGDDPVNRPDLLYWEIMDQGSRFGKLHNALSVPDGHSRRIDVSLSHGVKYAPADPRYAPLRTDQMKDRPEWWTPQGGPVPKDQRARMYD